MSLYVDITVTEDGVFMLTLLLLYKPFTLLLLSIEVSLYVDITVTEH